MAKNTGKHYRKGAVRERDQVHNPHIERWIKRDEQGKFIDQKVNGEPFKGVRKQRIGDPG